MKLYSPKYYLDFKCIADRCEHSCCIGWEIDIDENTLTRYKDLKNEYGSVIADSICMDETPHFRLCDGDRCPHLDENGLCRIILNVGEEALCHICREHPRFYNYTDVAEVGLGMSCAEAARIILSSPDYDVMEEIGTSDAEADGIEFDGRGARGAVYEILKSETLDYGKRLAEIYLRYRITAGEDKKWLEILSELEYLDEEHRPLFMKYSSLYRPRGTDEFLERFLAYLIYRHCTEATDEEDFAVRLSFCLFCERLLASLLYTENAESLRDVATLARIISEEIEYSDENTWALMQ